MIEEILNLLQKELDKSLINKNIQNVDKYNYDLLINNILDVIITITPGVNPIEPITQFTKNYITIKCKMNINNNNIELIIYIEIKRNIIISAESSILY